jgi:alanine dehydrogenase
MARITVGVPQELKDLERRIVLTPASVAQIVALGHRVLIESGAGIGSGFPDVDYLAAGGEIVPTPEDVWAADIVVKVKEPTTEEHRHFRPGLVLFAYLHLAAEPEMAAQLIRTRTAAFAFETLRDGTLILLAPMSEIAGRAAAIISASLLSTAAGGSGTLAGGAAGVASARALVIGMGLVGTMAARGLRGLDAHVTGLDLDPEVLRARLEDGTLDEALLSTPETIDEHIGAADIVIGAALVPGARAPQVVSARQVARMRAGSVVLDLAVDQGGCIETGRPTTLSDPTYLVDGVLHYCVTNVPGQFPRTASAALSAAVTPRLITLIEHVGRGEDGGVSDAQRAPSLAGLAESANIVDGHVVHAGVATALPELPSRL